MGDEVQTDNKECRITCEYYDYLSNSEMGLNGLGDYIKIVISCRGVSYDNLKKILRYINLEYRGENYKAPKDWVRMGYNSSEKIVTYNDLDSITKKWKTTIIKYQVEENEESIKPSNNGMAETPFFVGDFRRISADLIYVICCGTENVKNEEFKQVISKIKVEKIITGHIENGSPKEETYEIESLATKEILSHVQFKDNKGDVYTFPINFSRLNDLRVSYSSRFLDSSVNFFYQIYNENEKIDLDFCTIYKFVYYFVDLFIGHYGDEYGLFYYYQNELHPFIALKKNKEEKIIATFTDVKRTFAEGQVQVIDNEYTLDNQYENLFESLGKNQLANSKDNCDKLLKLKRKLYHEIYIKTEKKCSECIFVWNKKDEKWEYAKEGIIIKCKDCVCSGEYEFCFEIDNKNITVGYGNSVIHMTGNGDTCLWEYEDTEEKRFISLNDLYRLKGGRFSSHDFIKNYEKYTDNIKYVKDESKNFIDFVKKLKNFIDNNANNEELKRIIRSERSESREISEIFCDIKLNEKTLQDITDQVHIYKETQKVPNLVIMGASGTGKTTLAKKIADCFEGYVIDPLSPSDLKGAYIGQTIPKVYDRLVDASKNKKILFLDEAYLLQEDRFGREALAYLLPVMSGDRKVIIKQSEDIGEEGEVFNFEEGDHVIPPIWMAGYEHQMRKTLSENPGLYRRMVKLTLPSPNASDLYDNLTMLAGKLADNSLKLKEIFEEQSIQKDVKNYFIWAIARENAEYFGNYAGVQKFFETCKIRRVDNNNTSSARVLINRIIEENKKEIKAQYAAVLSKNEKSRKFVVSRDIDTTFKDVIGEAVTNKLKPIVDMLIDHERYYECGINVPKGALLVGPPGTGKTLLARAVAGEFQQSQKELDSDKQIAFISVIGTELSTPELVEELFSEAADYDAAIIFIDEIDSMGVKREYSHNPEPMFQLLKEMDGFEQRTNIFVMAATNAPEILDEALKRPGRFDRYIEVSYPTKEERKDIIKMYVEKLKWFRYEQSKENSNDETNNVSSDVANDNWDELYENIANKTKSFTPAQLKNLINEAAIDFYSLTPAQLKKLIKEAALNEDSLRLDQLMNLIDEAALNEDSLRLDQLDSSLKLIAFEYLVNEKIEQLIIGDKKPKPDEAKFSVEENKGCSAVAIHEVGHAMVCLLQGMEPFEKITILPRGNALGYVTPSSNNSLWTKQDYLNQIRALMGGRVAEELFYGEDDISVGAAQDIQSATKLAENMVAIFGMSEKIGVMSVKSDTSNFLGSVSKFECSESFRYDVEIEVRNLLRTQLEIVREELKKQKDIIKEMAEAVYGVETMSGDDFKKKYNEKRKEIEESSKKLRDSVSYDA